MKSDTIAGMIFFATFVVWCLYMAGWILYMSWPRKKGAWLEKKFPKSVRAKDRESSVLVSQTDVKMPVTANESSNARLIFKEPLDEFDIEQML